MTREELLRRLAEQMNVDKKAMREQPSFEARRLADFNKVAQFWTELGFRNVPDSDFYTFAPQLVEATCLAQEGDLDR